MRSPSQVRLEEATEYHVRRPFQINGRDYAPGDVVPGDVARSWPTLRSLINVVWLVPVFDVRPTVPVRVDAAPPAPKRGRR
jgi:hypothetical protein